MCGAAVGGRCVVTRRIGVFIAAAEFAIGIALVLGLLTPLASLGSLALLYHLRHVGDGQRVRVLCPVRHRHPGHLADLELARRRRVHRWLRPAPPRPPALGLNGTGPKRGHSPRSGGVTTCGAGLAFGPSDSSTGTCKFGPRRK